MEKVIFMNNKSIFENVISWIFGTLILAVGLINTFWGNDPEFGIFLMLLSLVYFLPVNVILKRVLGFTIPKMGIIKIVLAIFIIWVALGVGELFTKLELMKMDL